MSLIFIADLISIITALMIDEIQNSVVPVFIVLAIIKYYMHEKLELYKNKTADFVITAVTIVLDSGIMLKCTGLAPEMYSKEIRSIFISIAVCFGMTLLFRLLRTDEWRYDKSLTIISLLIAGLCVLSLSSKLVRRGDGAFKGGLFQVPEALKYLIVLLAVRTVRTNTESLRHYIGISLSAMFIMAAVIKETGTAILLAYFIPVSAFVIAYDMKKTDERAESILKSAPKLLVFFIAGIKLAEMMLLKLFPYRGEEGYSFLKYRYGDCSDLINKIINRLYEWSLRLSADGTQVVYARNILKDTYPVQFNFVNFADIIYADNKTALSDYALIELANSFGTYVAAFIVLIFLGSLISVIVKADVKGKIPAVCLAVQTLLQISGLLGYCFTGINVPFLSCGGSSTITSFAFLTMILISLSDVYAEEKKEIEV